MVSAVFLRARYLCSLRVCDRRRAYRGYGRKLFVKCLTTNWILISFGRPIRPLFITTTWSNLRICVFRPTSNEIQLGVKYKLLLIVRFLPLERHVSVLSKWSFSGDLQTVINKAEIYSFSFQKEGKLFSRRQQQQCRLNTSTGLSQTIAKFQSFSSPKLFRFQFIEKM